jgi:hypothetical protein
MTTLNGQGQSSQEIHRRGIAGMLLVQILALLVLLLAVAGYLEWSSAVNQAEFISLTGPLAFDPNQFPESSVPVQPVKGQTACYRKAQLKSR